ncbi:hypothetical protein D3C86_1177350 [compost metagenome]
MILVYNLLWAYTFLHRANSDRYTMLVRAADKFNILLAGTLKTHIYIGRQITSGKVPDVYWSVGIW